MRTATAIRPARRPRSGSRPDGSIDGFICAVGTGGTLAGVSAFLKHKNPNVVTAAADPMGASIYSWIKTGELKGQGSSISEGIGQGRVTGNLDGARIDDAFQDPRHGDAADPLRSVAERGAAARRL